MPERNECVNRGQHLAYIVRMTHLANKKPNNQFIDFLSSHSTVWWWSEKAKTMEWNGTSGMSNWVKDYDEKWLKVNEDAVASTKPKRTQ